ncbi:MAG TPA: LLM class flavin-dependent oxidoreductase [bacterium]
MAFSKRIGVGINSLVHSDDIYEEVLWAEEQGYESIWFRDGGGRVDAFTMAAAAAARTKRIRIVLSVVPVYTRPAAVFATSAATMSHLAPGRFVLGVGSSSHTMIEGWYGTPFEKPKTRVKETVQLLRSMLAGEKSDFQGKTIYSRNFKLGVPVKEKIPIYLAALRPGMLELAGEIGDGVVLNLAPVKALPRMLESLDKGAKRSGRRVEDLEIAILLSTYVTKNVEQARKDFGNVAVSYYSTPVYNEFLAWCGHEKEAKQITEGFAQKDRAKTLSALSPEILHSLAPMGDAETCRAMARAYHAAGVTTPIIVPASPLKAEHWDTLKAFTPTAFGKIA